MLGISSIFVYFVQSSSKLFVMSFVIEPAIPFAVAGASTPQRVSKNSSGCWMRKLKK